MPKSDVLSSDLTSVPTLAVDPPPENPIDFATLQSENPDICAWIKVSGTNVDYPILQSANDEDEDFYLDHDTAKNSKLAGSLYIQKLNMPGFNDNNTVVYGHNMKNGTMFGTLKKFRNKKFFDENQYVYVYTPTRINTYSIFSAFIYDDRLIMNAFNFRDPSSYQGFIDDCLNPSSKVQNIREGQNVTTDDKLLTLSTCTSADDERYLIVASLVSSVECKK